MDTSILARHPEFQRLAAEATQMVQSERRANEQKQLEAEHLRSLQGKALKDQATDALAQYEDLRRQVHALVGKIHELSVQYQNLTRQSMGLFPETKFRSINVPTLVPTNAWDSGFSTTAAAITQYFATSGRWS